MADSNYLMGSLLYKPHFDPEIQDLSRTKSEKRKVHKVIKFDYLIWKRVRGSWEGEIKVEESAYLLESDVVSVFAEAPTADMESVFSDDALGGPTDPAGSAVLPVSSGVRSLLLLDDRLRRHADNNNNKLPSFNR